MNKSTILISFILINLMLFSCETNKTQKSTEIPNYVPADIELFNEIVAMDKKYFDAYNSCDMKTQDSLYSDEIEFFHDKGGMMNSKEDILKAIKNNICGKVTRELIKGSMEVYSINNYGAVQIGYHKFHNNQEPDAQSIPSKFINIWTNENGKWEIKKVVSLH